MSLLFTGYIGLFFSCFLSATLLPFSSEAVVLFLLYKNYDGWLCLLIATTGNTVGGMTNYIIGLLGNPKWLQKLGIEEERIRSFELRIHKYGYWLALFSWVPFIGDPLTTALGFFRVSWKPVLLLVALGKFLRYLILILPFL
jgi:membrane protein YqaA with SNARE-associated domain